MTGSIIVVDDERSIRVGLRGLLTKEGHDVQTAGSGQEALQLLEDNPVDLVITDLRMPGLDGAQLLTHIKDKYPSTLVIMMTAYGSEKIAVEAMKAGAHDYIVKPFNNDEVKLLVHQALEQNALRREVRQLHERLDAAFRFDSILGTSPAMQHVFDMVKKGGRNRSDRSDHWREWHWQRADCQRRASEQSTQERTVYQGQLRRHGEGVGRVRVVWP